MQVQIAVLSQDRDFARMLELEFGLWHLRVLSAPHLEKEDYAQIVILDLDSAAAPSESNCGQIIGVSRHPAMQSAEARRCSLILRRPFEMNLLRREVLGKIQPAGIEPFRGRINPEKRVLRLSEQTQTLFCDGEQIQLTPTEFTLVKSLLSHRGEAVSRAELARAIGCEQSNEVDVLVCYLRKKTDSTPGGRLIATVRKQGYSIA